LHQAIEAKEGIKVRNESKTLATITLQNYFRMYKKLAGMTGTAKTEENEFQNIYGMDVVQIPTNLPVMRIDEVDHLYKNRAIKIRAIVKEVSEAYHRGQPILVGTVSVEKSEFLSNELKKARIPHNVLNAKNHEQEAEIIAQAGKKGAVTIATNMAGRGTDILLGGNPAFLARTKLENLGYEHDILVAATSVVPVEVEEDKRNTLANAREDYQKYYNLFKAETDKEKQEVIALGGLRILATERHESRRIDNQLRGRSGRQGDPGSSVFFLSMEDDLIRIFGDTMVTLGERLPDTDEPITLKVFTRGIARAQERIEDRNYSIRKHVLAYDDVMNKQREVIYGEREKVLSGEDVHEQIVKMIPDVVAGIVQDIIDFRDDYHTWDYAHINEYLEQRVVPQSSNVVNESLASEMDIDVIIDAVVEAAIKGYEAKKDLFNERCRILAEENGLKQDYSFADVERDIMLQVVDGKWIDHIDDMDALRKGIGLRQYGQTDPVIGYQQEGYELFNAMTESIQETLVNEMLRFQGEPALRSAASPVRTRTKLAAYPDHMVTNERGTVVRKEGKVGRNDPCPCGSGKKYKNCCGAPGAIKKF
ncbi:MAG: SEC-C domain-containing protein, partial [Clostridia bacterium]|nr:SEC-C domain-containing protein [Clostridia bacterium]